MAVVRWKGLKPPRETKPRTRAAGHPHSMNAQDFKPVDPSIAYQQRVNLKRQAVRCMQDDGLHVQEIADTAGDAALSAALFRVRREVEALLLEYDRVFKTGKGKNGRGN